MTKNSRLVYSTDKGKITETKTSVKTPVSDGFVRIFRETKGRGGKSVSVIKGLSLSPAEIAILAKELKQLCGTGGTQKDFDIEIQGDHREKIKDFLEKKGFKVKLAGG